MATRKRRSKTYRKTNVRKTNVRKTNVRKSRRSMRRKRGGCGLTDFLSASSPSVNNNRVPLLGRLGGTPSRYIGAQTGYRSR